MENSFDGHFFNPTKGKLTLEEVIEEMRNYMKEKPDMFYDIIVGCDSSSSNEPHFPVAVAILRVGEGGRFFLKKIKYSSSFNKKFVNWRNRILQEVLLSCDLALLFKERFNQKMNEEIEKEVFEKGKPRYQIRYIHADIGENGQTKEMIKELTSLIRSNGFEPKIKPESFIASSVANKYS